MPTLGNFGPADTATLSDATDGLPLHGYEGLSAALVAKIDDHNARAEKVRSQLTASLDGFENALARITEGAEPAAYGELFASVESAKIDRTTLMVDLSSLWTNRLTLVDSIRGELEKKLAPAETAFEKVVAEVKAELTKIGSGLEAQPAYGVDSDGAEQQFDYAARNRNVRSREAHRRVSAIRVAIESTYDQHRASREGQATAIKFVRTVARRMLIGAA